MLSFRLYVLDFQMIKKKGSVKTTSPQLILFFDD